MAELFMECEEEELEPWQKKVKEVEDDDDDEPIFVGEIASSKPAISNILNRVNPSSYSRGIKNGALSRGITAAFRPTSQHYKNPTSIPVAASPVNFHAESRSSDSSVIVQPLSKPFCGSGVGHGLAGSSPSRSHTATFKMWALRLQSHLKLNWGSISFQVLVVIGSIRFPKGFRIESLSISLASGWLLARWAFLIWLKSFFKEVCP